MGKKESLTKEGKLFPSFKKLNNATKILIMLINEFSRLQVKKPTY